MDASRSRASYVRPVGSGAHGSAATEAAADYDRYERRSWIRVSAGALLVGALGLAVGHAGISVRAAPLLFAALGAAVAYALEGRRMERVNEVRRRAVVEALRSLADRESEARREAVEASERKEGWTRLVEEEMTSRDAALRELVAGIREMQEQRASKVLGVSHDLRNPLQVIVASAQYLEDLAPVMSHPGASDCVRDIALSAQRMRSMLTELVQIAKAQREFVPMYPRRVETSALTEGLRRRLRALAHGRDIRATVSAAPEAPASLRVDPMALDRITDNLLTNAVKYTEHGSIVVEVDGFLGFLVITVSDTGKGIEGGDVQRIFEPGGSSAESRRGDSFGVGLSVVVQLLYRMGGRLEVMTRPRSGTTFWVFLPLEPPSAPDLSADVPAASPGGAAESAARALKRVVRVRKQLAG
jgi:signal transduction histidine kinase